MVRFEHGHITTQSQVLMLLFNNFLRNFYLIQDDFKISVSNLTQLHSQLLHGDQQNKSRFGHKEEVLAARNDLVFFTGVGKQAFSARHLEVLFNPLI